MSDTPKLDFATLLQFESMQNQIEELTTLLRKAERERDEAMEQREEWRITASSLKVGEIELLKENAKLRDIAERAVDYLNQSYRNGFEDEANELRAELDQLTQLK